MLDRLARSLSDLLEVIEGLEAKGVHFKSLRDPVDTSSPQGKFTLQVLGAAAELERALIRERTLAGLKSARAKGRIGGNPGLRSKDPGTLRKMQAARDEALFRRLEESAQDWVPEVRRLRPVLPWEDVARIINARLPSGAQQWSRERLIRAAKRYVREGFLMTIVAAIAGSAPDITLQQIADRLEVMRERTPRGRAKWFVSSVKMLLDRAKTRGLITAERPK